MNKKLCKIFIMLMIICTVISISTISASALSWDGSSTGGGGAGSPAGPNGYAIRTTGDNCLGYRFSVVDKNGNNKVSKVIDVFRNTSYGNMEYSSAYKFTTKYNKKQLINYQNNGFSTSKNTTNCYKEANMGFASFLPVASGMSSWQNNTTNINAVLSALGVGNINNLVNGDKIIVEPLYDIRLQSIYHSLTVTETALYGKWILGASSNGGSSYTSETWGFISSYTNRYYPNELYTTDGQGLWTGTGAVGSSSRETFYNIINKGYGSGIAYTETKPDFSPTLNVNLVEAWPGAKSSRTSHFGISRGSTIANFTYANGYPTLNSTIWYAVNFPAESQTCRVRQYVRLSGGAWTTRDVNLSSSDTGSMWFDVALSPTTVDAARSSYMVEAKQDWIDSSGNILKSGAVKSFYIPVKPKINRNQVTMYDIQGNQVAKANANSTNQVGSVYVGQQVYAKYSYTSENSWPSYNYLRGAMYGWINGVWNTVYPNNGGTDLYVDNQAINNATAYERYSDIGLYRVPDNSANTNGSNRIPFKLWTHWASDINNTTETTWIDIPVIKADVELADILLIDERGYYITSSQLYLGQKVTVQYVYKNNTNCDVYVEGYNNDNSRIPGVYLIPANSQIYVTGYTTTITSTSLFSVWGGVYLDGAGRLNTSWEKEDFDSQWNNHWVRYWSVTNPISIEFINPRSSYREGTEVISSFKIKNSSSFVFYPSSNVTVYFRVYKGSTLIYMALKTGFVIPSNGENLVYWRWTVPKGLFPPYVTMTTQVYINGISATSRTDINPATTVKNSTTPDTRFEKSAPAGFVKPNTPSTSGVLSSSWSEWVYESGMLVKKNYGLLISSASNRNIPDINCPTRKNTGGIWYMGSGYGLTSNFSLNIINIGSHIAATTSYTNAQTANMYLPEYNYSTAVSSYRSLVRIGTNTFELPVNTNALNNAKLHFVPLWFPDGSYYTIANAGDIWTPAGVMYGNFTSNNIMISKSAYDDWIIGR